MTMAWNTTCRASAGKPCRRRVRRAKSDWEHRDRSLTSRDTENFRLNVTPSILISWTCRVLTVNVITSVDTDTAAFTFHSITSYIFQYVCFDFNNNLLQSSFNNKKYLNTSSVVNRVNMLHCETQETKSLAAHCSSKLVDDEMLGRDAI